MTIAVSASVASRPRRSPRSTHHATIGFDITHWLAPGRWRKRWGVGRSGTYWEEVLSWWR